MAKHKDRDPTNSKPAAAVTALARGGTAASRDGSNSGVSSGGRNKGGRGRGRSLTGAITKPGRGRGRGDGVCSDLSAATEQPIVGKQVGTVKQPSAVKQLRKEQKQKQKQKQKQQWTKPKLPKQKQPQAGAENSGAQQALERMAQTLVSHPTEWQDHQPASPPVAGDRSSGRQPGSCPACGAAWLHDSSSGSTPRTSALSPGDWAFLQQLADKLERDRLDRITHQQAWERHARLKVSDQENANYETELSSDEDECWDAASGLRDKGGPAVGGSGQQSTLCAAAAAPQSPPAAVRTARRAAAAAAAECAL